MSIPPSNLSATPDARPDDNGSADGPMLTPGVGASEAIPGGPTALEPTPRPSQQLAADPGPAPAAPQLPHSPRESSDQLSRLKLLLKVSQLINASSDPEARLRSLLREVVRITRATSGSIAMVDHDRGILDIATAINIPVAKWKNLKLHLGVGITGWVAYTGKPMRAADVRRNSHYVQLKPDIRSELAVPLLLEGRVLGVINVDSTRRGAFSQLDEDLLVAVASHSARIIETARLHDAAQRHAQELESLFTLSQGLIAPLPITTLLQQFIDEGRRLMPATLGLLALFDPERRALSLRAISGARFPWPGNLTIEIDGSVLGQVIRTGEPIRISNILQEPHVQFPELVREEGLISLLAAPLLYRGEILGVLAFAYDRHRSFEVRELRLVQLMAGQFASALVNGRNYEQILQMEESLRQSERFSLLGSLAAEVAHELRNPINIIQMLLHTMAEDLAHTHHGRDLAIVMDKLDRINRTVDQMLDLGRNRALELTPVDLNGILGDLLFFLRFKLDQAGIKYSQKLEDELPHVPADRSQIQQIFLNLMINAIQAMPQGGKLVVKTSRRAEESIGDCVEVSITDTGVGISEDAQARLFDPFFTTRKEGTGLGLFVSNKLVSNHGGKISVKSAPGKGTTFRILLPLEFHGTPAPPPEEDCPTA